MKPRPKETIKCVALRCRNCAKQLIFRGDRHFLAHVLPIEKNRNSRSLSNH